MIPEFQAQINHEKYHSLCVCMHRHIHTQCYKCAHVCVVYVWPCNVQQKSIQNSVGVLWCLYGKPRKAQKITEDCQAGNRDSEERRVGVNHKRTCKQNLRHTIRHTITIWTHRYVCSVWRFKQFINKNCENSQSIYFSIVRF